MKKLVLSLALAVAAVAASAPLATAQSTCPTAPTPIVVSGSITSNTTWTSNNIYLLQGFVFVENGATLTIQPGTIIKGDQASKGTLTIKQGARIEARGTATQPIVFTSNQPAGSRARGDWGGLILCGRAPQNIPATATQLLPKIEGGLTPDAYFGGTDPNDNSGTLQYVRIEFPGIAFSTDNEINGLTLGGVGAGTTIDHVQVSYSGDDSFEWFGGTVNAKYLVAFRGIDDEFDTDNGFSGKVQFGVSLRDPNVADVSGSNAFESDNDASGSTNSPQTSAVFSNMSVFIAPTTGTLNSNYKRAMHIRRNSALSVFNSVLTGYPVGLLLDEGSPIPAANSAVNATNGTLVLKNNVFAGFRPNQVATRVNGSTYNVKQFLANGNDTTSTVASLLLDQNNFNLSAPYFVPQNGSPLATGASFADAKLSSSFFTPVTYRGAFAPNGGAANWLTTWTEFNPQNFCYNRPGVVTAAHVKAEKTLQMGVYPNPTAGAARLSFALPQAAVVTVRVFDSAGRTVATVAQDRSLPAGVQLIELPASLPAGLYTATVQTAETSDATRFVVTK